MALFLTDFISTSNFVDLKKKQRAGVYYFGLTKNIHNIHQVKDKQTDNNRSLFSSSKIVSASQLVFPAFVTGGWHLAVSPALTDGDISATVV